jgi:hypothetical protein
VIASSLLALPGSITRAICPGSARNSRCRGELSWLDSSMSQPPTTPQWAVHTAGPGLAPGLFFAKPCKATLCDPHHILSQSVVPP